MVAADGEWFGKGHGVLWTLIALAPGLILGRTHHEAAYGQHHHFRAGRLAVAEDFAWGGLAGGLGTGGAQTKHGQAAQVAQARREPGDEVRRASSDMK